MNDCAKCGPVSPEERNGRYVYFDCGVENVVLLNTPQEYCPHCGDWLGVVITAMAQLHQAIAVALCRKKALTEAEMRFIKKTPSIRNTRWKYRRRGQLIELALLPGNETEPTK